MISDLAALESNMQIRLLDSGLSTRGGVNVAVYEFLELQQKSVPFGVLVRVYDGKNLAYKIYSLMLASIRISKLSRLMSGKGVSVKAVYAVYPSVSEPVAIYSLGTTAEDYTNRYVMPGFGGASGKLRKVIMRIIGFHPSVAGVIVTGVTN